MALIVYQYLWMFLYANEIGMHTAHFTSKWALLPVTTFVVWTNLTDDLFVFCSHNKQHLNAIIMWYNVPLTSEHVVFCIVYFWLIMQLVWFFTRTSSISSNNFIVIVVFMRVLCDCGYKWSIRFSAGRKHTLWNVCLSYIYLFHILLIFSICNCRRGFLWR